MCNVFYLNGDTDSQYKIVEGSRLYDYLSGNYHNQFDVDGNESLVVSGDVLEDIIGSELSLSDDEDVLVGFMLYHLEYTGGFIFS